MRKFYALALAGLLVVGCSGEKKAEKEEAKTDTTPKQETEMAKPTTGMPDLSQLTFESGPEGMEYHVITKGDGPKVNTGQKAEMHYTVWLTDGRKMDSSRDRGKTFSFTLGNREVIRGWDMAVAMMHVGDRWILKLPPELAYGNGRGAIPPNATLVFDMEVISAK